MMNAGVKVREVLWKKKKSVAVPSIMNVWYGMDVHVIPCNEREIVVD